MGDQIDVFVIEDSSFNGTYPVRNSGDIIIPKLGRVPVAGRTLPEAEQLIRSGLLASQLKEATVVVDPGPRNATDAAAQGIVIRLSGRVMKPGRAVMPQIGSSPVTAYQAVSDGGGFAPFANKSKSYIIRVTERGTSRIPVNFASIEEGAAQDVPLSEGDTIVVPQKMFGF